MKAAKNNSIKPNPPPPQKKPKKINTFWVIDCGKFSHAVVKLPEFVKFMRCLKVSHNGLHLFQFQEDKS